MCQKQKVAEATGWVKGEINTPSDVSSYLKRIQLDMKWIQEAESVTIII